MVRRRTIKTVNSSFIDDIYAISKLLNAHLTYLRVDSPHYKVIAELNSHAVDVGKQLHDGSKRPWAWGSTGPATP